MELWIRSQNKNFMLKVDNICIEDNYIKTYDKNHNGYEMYYGTYLGTYKTKERALEVLDEVQSHIQKQGKMELDNEVGLKYYGNVYEMPKE